MVKTRSLPPPPVQDPGVVRFEDILRRLDEQNRPYNRELLSTAHEFSAAMHQDQVRRSGEPYLTHPLAVADLLVGLKFDDLCVVVGLLHDVLEDTLTTHEILVERFGEEVAELVEGVTKIGRHSYVRRDDAQAETFRKMILASAKDLRVIVVKLADRLHNMMTLEHLPPEKRRRISRETLEIYAPIAHRLGMARVQGDLEDLAFYYLWPLQFAELHSKIAEKMKVGHDAVEGLRDRLQESLAAAGIEAEISFRVKRYYSIWRKLRRQGIDISQLYDYLAFRIITTSLRDTYAALGVVHQGWRPVPGRFKDYIAMPKPNLYQSLHTSLMSRTGQPFEIQIRTREMDLIAEEGIAAHWRYKEGKGNSRGGQKEGDPNILWLRQLLEWQKEIKDPRTFLTTLKIDLYPDEVYVFTPKGDVLSFPRGATPLDFAYKVHTELGHHCVGARVNGRLVPLRTPLGNGDMVEVLTNPSRNPSRDWLNIVATSRAKSKVRQWLNTEQKQRAMEIGRRVLEKEARRAKLSFKRLTEGEAIRKYLEEEGLTRIEELYSRVGFGRIQARQVIERLVPPEKRDEAPEREGTFSRVVRSILPQRGPIEVKGHGDLLAYLAKCCNPIPGEKIIGYITRGHGVSVHSADCPNVRNLMFNPEREIEVSWARSGDEIYRIALVIETENRPGMLARLADAMAKLDTNIAQLQAGTDTGRGEIVVVVELRDLKHLEKLTRGIRSIPGVLRVDRRMSGLAGHSDSDPVP